MLTRDQRKTLRRIAHQWSMLDQRRAYERYSAWLESETAADRLKIEQAMLMFEPPAAVRQQAETA